MENIVVKLTDFGLSRNLAIYTVSSTSSVRPIAWTALESLEHGIVSKESDIW